MVRQFTYNDIISYIKNEVEKIDIKIDKIRNDFDDINIKGE